MAKVIAEKKEVPELRWVEDIADLMDSRFTLPGTNFKFGLDPIMGLVPGIGSVTSLAISGFLLLIMARHGASRKIVILMTLNILIDTVIGGIPFVGNAFDFFYKSNKKNIRLLKKHYHEGKHQGSGAGILIAIGIIFLLLTGLIIWGIYKLVVFLIHLL